MTLDLTPRRRAPHRTRLAGVFLAVTAALLPFGSVRAADFDLKADEHVALIGNTLPDRMQHFGWLETNLQSRFPDRRITIRNLGFSGDELTVRMRSADFGTPDEWLTRVKANTVLAFFGYNESFGDLGKFRKDLDGFIDHTLAQKYDGKAAPRLVLFSPIAHEAAKGRDLPDGRENNARLEKLTAVMAEAAKAKNITFVDLFHPSQAAFAKSTEPLTINGIHLNEKGDRAVADIIDRSLFAAAPAPRRDAAALERIRNAVLDKNFTWFNRYRTVDGYSIYGGRADLKFVAGQTNRVVMQREMEILDAMTANRDRAVWAAANGRDYRVDDSNTPPFIPVVTNKPGPGPNGAHVFLDGGDESISKMTIGKGLKINLFASEKEFPLLQKPVQMSFDTKGRLWVAAWPSYPHWKPKDKMDDKLLIYEDTDGDGKADKETVFADGLHCPTGFELANGGVYVAMAPDLLFLKDTDGDDKADVRERVLSGLDSADTHHTSNSFRLDPGGALYFQEGTFHRSQVETPYGPPVRLADAGVFRYEPKSQKFEVYVSYPFANPHGHSFDHWGQDFVTDGTGNINYYATAFSGHVDFPMKHNGLKPFFPQRTRPCPGTEILSSRHFPDDWQGNYLVGNVIGFQGIHRYIVKDDGSGFGADEAEPIVSSSDPNFRPADIEVGPDGALYFLEWQNPIIGHMQHNLRDPSRDQKHGRVYRVTYEGRPLLKPKAIAGRPIPELLDLLKEPEDRVRYRAKVELSARDTKDVMAALGKWVAALDKNDPEYEHHVLEALWLHQFHDDVDLPLLKRVLASPDFRARAAAVRVLCYQRDRVPGALDLLKKAAADSYPRVRLEAVRAASFFTDAEAVEIPLISAEHPTDYFLDYSRAETMRTLEPYWRKAISEGRPINVTSDAGARFLLGNVGLEDLLKMKRTRAVSLELLFRKGVREEIRRAALNDLAKQTMTTPTVALLEALKGRDSREADPGESVLVELGRISTDLPPAELNAARGDIEKIATTADLPALRQLGFAALVAADGNADAAWDVAGRSVQSLRDMLNAVALVRDPGVRDALYTKIEPLLSKLPAKLASKAPGKGSLGRYVRVELPGNRTLTLAEVEVYSDGRNVARQGKASQKNTGFGGEAARGIDGKTGGSYGQGGQTHSEENTLNPWWEVDLGAEVPIDSIVIYNRTDGQFHKRLDNYTLKVLDGRRNPVFESHGRPAPEKSVAIELEGAGPEGLVRRAAMNALTYVRGRESETFKTLAKFVRDDVDRHSAILAIGRIPKAQWPTDEAKPLLDSILGYLRKLPPQDRASAPAVDAIGLGDALTALLPADQARPLRKELRNLGVRIIRVGTVLEQMRYDVERIVVEAGKPFIVQFENGDLMPHNFVVTRPGALEEVGRLAESTAQQPGAIERQYVPPSDKVLSASRLLQPRESQRLELTAPGEAGVYPFVCTYPGHWTRMYGSMYVVENLDDYLTDPDGYLAGHPLKIQDELLKFTRPRKEWTYDELASSIDHLEPGRSFSNAQQLFRLASCTSCHKVNNEGVDFGPDLAKLDAKQKPTDILRNVLEPSTKIDDKYASYLFDLESGQVVTGMILSETTKEVKVIENPLAKAEPRTLAVSEITERKRSPVSMMPKGLLDKLSREEILDLLAYVIARGDRNHPLFKAKPGHEGHGGH